MTLRQNDLKQKNHGRFCIEKNIRITTTPIRHPKTKQKTRNKTTTCRGPAPVVRSVAKCQATRRTFCRVNRPWSSLGRNVNPATWKYYKQAAKWNGQPTALSPSRLAAAPLESGDRDMFDTGLTCPCGADHSHKWFFCLFFFLWHQQGYSGYQHDRYIAARGFLLYLRLSRPALTNALFADFDLV